VQSIALAVKLPDFSTTRGHGGLLKTAGQPLPVNESDMLTLEAHGGEITSNAPRMSHDQEQHHLPAHGVAVAQAVPKREHGGDP
jgi:hypothetical protein